MAPNFIQGKKLSELSNDSTTSLMEHLPEDFQFEPKLQAKVRKTSSMDDISRFYRYYYLVQDNLGGIFTWNQYLDIMRPEQDTMDTFTDQTEIPYVQTIEKGHTEVDSASQMWDCVKEQKSKALHENTMMHQTFDKTCAVISAPSKTLSEISMASRISQNVSEISIATSNFGDYSQPDGESFCGSISSTISLKSPSRALMVSRVRKGKADFGAFTIDPNVLYVTSLKSMMNTVSCCHFPLLLKYF